MFSPSGICFPPWWLACLGGSQHVGPGDSLCLRCNGDEDYYITTQLTQFDLSIYMFSTYLYPSRSLPRLLLGFGTQWSTLNRGEKWTRLLVMPFHHVGKQFCCVHHNDPNEHNQSTRWQYLPVEVPGALMRIWAAPSSTTMRIAWSCILSSHHMRIYTCLLSNHQYIFTL